MGICEQTKEDYKAQKAIMKFQFLPDFGNPQVDKKILKYWKEFLWYFTILETYRGQLHAIWSYKERPYKEPGLRF